MVQSGLIFPWSIYLSNATAPHLNSFSAAARFSIIADRTPFAPMLAIVRKNMPHRCLVATF